MKPPASPTISHAAPPADTPDANRVPFVSLAIAIGAVTLAFSVPLYQLARFSVSSELYSHIVLLPFICSYLIHLRRSSLPRQARRDLALAAVFATLGAGLLAGYWSTTATLPRTDELGLLTASYLAFLVATLAYFLGRAWLRRLAFPLALMVFCVPLPTKLINAIEAFLQHGSAEVSYWMFNLVGTPVYRVDLILQLPGITLLVAPECSGIHSTLALFITSLVAGAMFLQSRVHRTLLACAVVPLAFLRNGLRIFTIGELCVRVSPDMIHSFIHQQGGPIFFGISLVPLVLLLVYLRRRERCVVPPQ